MQTTPGERFVTSLAAKDGDGLRAVLVDDVDFRGLTPGAAWEAEDAGTLVDEILLHRWFEPSDEIGEVLSVETDTVGDVQRVAYRLAVRNPRGDHLVEQQAYYRADGDRIRWLRIMCSGYLRAG